MRERVSTPSREALKAWYDDSAPRWSAAIAFYTIFSLAPVLVIVTAVAGALWGDQAVRHEVLGQFRDLLGDRGAQQVDQLIRAALPPGGGGLATAAGVGTLLLGATAVFTTLRNALNSVWGVVPAESPGIWRNAWTYLWTRVLSVAVVLCMAFLLAASLVVSAGLSALGGWMGERLPAPVPVLRLADTAVTFGVLWLLYLGRSGVASAYGVAGSVVLILLWVYYSAMVFLLGAEFTEVYSRRWGSHIRALERPEPKPRPPDGFSAPRAKGPP
jgi:membrane protein